MTAKPIGLVECKRLLGRHLQPRSRTAKRLSFIRRHARSGRLERDMLPPELVEDSNIDPIHVSRSCLLPCSPPPPGEKEILAVGRHHWTELVLVGIDAFTKVDRVSPFAVVLPEGDEQITVANPPGRLDETIK